MADSTRRRLRPAILVVSLLLIGTVAAYLLTHRYAVYDAVRLNGYNPPTAISSLADDTTMTDYARHVYYVNHPELQERKQFASNCPSGTEQTAVLGCYKSGQAGIYVLNVQNSELAGIQQVTAAHEMLHAAYDRLNKSERKRVDAMLQDYYDNRLTDQTIKDTIASYKKTEPTELVNEMHSILGTEVTSLPTNLEQYYSRYFSDRSRVATFYTTYEKAFTSRQALLKQYDTQLADWKTQIAALDSSVDTQFNSLKDQRGVLDGYLSAGNRQAYNNNVSSYNRAVGAYNSDVASLRSLIDKYNQLVATRNSTALEEQELVKSITSSATAL